MHWFLWPTPFQVPFLCLASPVLTRGVALGDCCHRDDMHALENGDLNHAQAEKIRLEMAQRADKKLRQAGKK